MFLIDKLAFDERSDEVRDLDVAVHTAHFQPFVQRRIDVDG